MRFGRVIVLLVVVGLLVVTPAHAARLFNGTNQSLQSASTVDLSAQNKISVQLWLWWDAYANDNDAAIETGTNFLNPVNGLLFVPNDSNTTQFLVIISDGATPGRYFTRPSAAAWHHYVVTLDRTVGSSAAIAAVYVDGAVQSLTQYLSGAVSGNWCNCTWNFMSRANSSLFGAGRLAEVAVWSVLLTQGNVTSLYNNGLGALATNVQGGSLLHYWRIRGLQSPEPASVGGISLTVNGATFTPHPVNLDVAPRSAPPKDARSRSRGRLR